MRGFGLLWVLLVACHGSEESDASNAPTSPVVVYFVVDTLGASAAAQTGLCEVVSAVARAHGTDAACVGDAVAPSSWTGESHVRMLWPEHLAGTRRRTDQPDCDAQSMMAAIAAGTGGTYVIGAQNSVLGGLDSAPCRDGQNPWFVGADVVHRGEREGDDSPVGEGIVDLLAATASGAPAVALLNSVEAGAHLPRCSDDASTPSCSGLFDLAVEYGFVPADLPAERRAAWWADGKNTFRFFARVQRERDVARAAPLVAGTIHERILAHQARTVVQRLEELVGGLQAQGRLADLTLVVTSDHGENPCFAEPVLGQVNCAHTGAPTEWTAAVPVAVVPASRAGEWQASGLVGGDGVPWSTTALAWGLTESAGVAPPSAWLEAPRLGVATSWSCMEQSRTSDGPSRFGLHVSESGSLRCADGTCGAWSWTTFSDPLAVPVPLDTIPAELVAYAGPPDWATNACR